MSRSLNHPPIMETKTRLPELEVSMISMGWAILSGSPNDCSQARMNSSLL